MKPIPHINERSFIRRFTTFSRPVRLWLAGVVLLAAALSAPAGSLFSDFNSGLPDGTTPYGVARILPDQGYTNSPCLLLTTNAGSQTGTFIITNALDGGTPVVGFVARFKVYIGPLGGTGADGFSFNFCPDLLTNPAPILFGEEGRGTGLGVAFDTYSNGEADPAGIDVKVGGLPIVTAPLATTILRTGAWVDVTVMQHPDGLLGVAYDGTWVYTNNAYTGLGASNPMTNWYFALGARTGNSFDNHFIDNLSIETLTDGTAFVYYYAPIGRQARADAPVEIVLNDFYNPVSGSFSQVDPASIVMTVDGAAVTPSVTPGGGQTTVRYVPPTIFASGSTHSVSVTYADLTTPVANTNTWQWSFTAATYSVIPGPVSASLVSANPGFDLHINQSPVNAGNDLVHAESQLAGLIIDPGTGLPYTNLATVSTSAEANPINYSQVGYQGSFPYEAPGTMPGLPGTEGGTTNTVMDAITYLYMVPGIYTLGVNSSDGFQLLLSTTPDYWATTEMSYNGTRAATDTTVSFGVTTAGYYPFRILYFNGGPEAPYPSLDNPSLEFFSIDPAGNKILINDTTVSGHIPAYRTAQTLPYVRSVSPAPNSEGVATNSAIDVVLVDGSITVQTGTIQMLVNSSAVTPAITTSGGVTTVHYQPASGFLMDATNAVQFAFTDSAGTRRTNVWKFTTEKIMSWLWRIPTGLTPWVSSTATDRGIAYNPKSGHVLIVSRNATAPVNGLGIGIFDGATGNYLGLMNVGSIASDTGCTFTLNMIGVGEDGVIYACDLTTSASHVFRIYRWQDENAAPTLAWSGSPTGGKTRWGDAIRVRGSGAGTRVMTGSDDPSGTGNPAVPLFTTTDGTNFSLTVLSVAGGQGGGHRLGLAFDCTNSFYGCVNGTPIQYVRYNGPPSTAASRIAQMNIYDINGTATRYIAPIGLDIINRRLYGIGTGSAPNHNCSMFDLPLATSGNVVPRDAKSFPRAATSWATGNIDMTPDGTKVYGLDTGNGVIAFGVAPKLAAPTIWGQPKDFYAAPDSKLGYVDVEGVGAPQNYQWRFSGRNPADPAVPIANATNRTLDLYELQQSQLGYYSVVITNSMGSVTSSLALVDFKIVITNQPVSLTVYQGDPATFSVGAYGGADPVTCQWQLNNVDIPGATGPSYTIPAADYTNGAYLGYKCVITDAFTQTVASASVTLNVLMPVPPPAGSGTGLLGAYYTNINYGTATTPPNPFVGTPALTRVDPNVDFDWLTGSFDTGDPTMPADYFQVRWSGQIQPLYSQNYIFFTTSDDGQRLWVNGVKLIDDWLLHGPTERTSPSIALTGGQKYDIIYEYFEKTSGAVARLGWWSSSQLKANVPMEQLYPVAFSAPTITLTAPPSGTLLTTNGTVTLSATVTPNNGVVNKVQFYRGGTTLIGEALSAPYTYDWVRPAPGSHNINARAVYNEVSAVNSDTNSITVIPPTPAWVGGISVDTSSCSISGTGAVGQTFILLNATNLVSPVAWTPVATNSTGSGTFNFNLPIGSEGQSFFKVQSW